MATDVGDQLGVSPLQEGMQLVCSSRPNPRSSAWSCVLEDSQSWVGFALPCGSVTGCAAPIWLLVALILQCPDRNRSIVRSHQMKKSMKPASGKVYRFSASRAFSVDGFKSMKLRHKFLISGISLSLVLLMSGLYYSTVLYYAEVGVDRVQWRSNKFAHEFQSRQDVFGNNAEGRSSLGASGITPSVDVSWFKNWVPLGIMLNTNSGRSDVDRLLRLRRASQNSLFIKISSYLFVMVIIFYTLCTVCDKYTKFRKRNNKEKELDIEIRELKL